MAWTAPSTYAVGQVLAAAQLNIDVRDNLNYLRGLAGAVNIRASLAVTDVGSDITPANLLHVHSTTTAAGKIKLSSSAPGFELQDHVADASRLMYGGLGFGTAAGHFGGGAGDMNFYTSANAGSQTNGIRFSTARDTSGNYASRLFAPGGYATGAGRIGINTDTPQGALHVRNLISACLYWEYDGVDGTARTVIADGAGDVLYRLVGMYVSRADDGTTASGVMTTGTFVPGAGTTALHTTGADTLSIRFNANGSVDVLRSAGTTRTFKVALWMAWL